jgi:hypothetical protein
VQAVMTNFCKDTSAFLPSEQRIGDHPSTSVENLLTQQLQLGWLQPNGLLRLLVSTGVFRKFGLDDHLPDLDRHDQVIL